MQLTETKENKEREHFEVFITGYKRGTGQSWEHAFANLQLNMVKK